MSASRLSRVCGCLAAFSSVAGCGSAGFVDNDLAQTTQAVVGVDEYLFLRCNSTGWAVNDSTRLAASGQPGVYSIEYEVAAGYMTNIGDQCVVTRTNSANGWGTQNASFGAQSTGTVNAPGQWTLGPVNSNPVTIRYPAVGRYRADVDWNNGTVRVTAAVTQPQEAQYYYLRCNATGWSPSAQNRMIAAADGLRLTYAVNQSWMMSSGDQCVVTRTNQLDGWGSTQTSLGTATAATIVVPAGSGVTTPLVSPGQQFTVRYPAIGSYQASLNPTTGQLRILVPGSDVPQTGLHGIVESLGDNRVRVTYDFQTAEQLQDFVSTNSATTAVSIEGGRLVVAPTAGSGGVNVARLVKGFKADSIRYRAELLSGDHVNVYIGTRWDGAWNPARGYGAIHYSNGRLFVGNGVSAPTSVSDPVAPGVVYTGRIDATERGLTWTVNGDEQSFTTPYYGGTSRTIALGGYASTVAFDDVVLEGTVEGFESDGTETNPNVNHGNVSNLPDGRVRITYDFSDPQQKYDFVVNHQQATRRELNDGRLIVNLAGDQSPLQVALYKYNLQVDRLAYEAELLAGDHVNVYLNAIWDGAWAPAVGCAGIHYSDGRIIATNGVVSATSDTNPVAPRTPYSGNALLTAAGLDWDLNGALVSLTSPCYSGLDGTVGLGSWGSDVAFDNLVIEGRLR